jgi:hypothetical protein
MNGGANRQDEELAPAGSPAFARSVAGADDGYPIAAKVETDRRMNVWNETNDASRARWFMLFVQRWRGSQQRAQQEGGAIMCMARLTVQLLESPSLSIEEKRLIRAFAALFLAHLRISLP